MSEILTVEHIQQLMTDLKAEYGSSTDAYSWTISTETYQVIRWLHHLGKLRPLPARKLRKCHLRKIQRFLKRERRRYL